MPSGVGIIAQSASPRALWSHPLPAVSCVHWQVELRRTILPRPCLRLVHPLIACHADMRRIDSRAADRVGALAHHSQIAPAPKSSEQGRVACRCRTHTTVVALDDIWMIRTTRDQGGGLHFATCPTAPTPGQRARTLAELQSSEHRRSWSSRKADAHLTSLSALSQTPRSFNVRQDSRRISLCHVVGSGAYAACRDQLPRGAA